MSIALHSVAFALVPMLAALLHQAHQALDRDAGDARARLDEGSDLLNRLNSGQAAGGDEASNLLPWQVRRLQAHIEAHLDRDLPVPELAAVVHRSRSYFSRIFKASFGIPPHAYVMRRRLARAQGLMTGTDENLAVIAASCGYSDQAHFCRMFRNAMGCTPREWRRRHSHEIREVPSARIGGSDLQSRKTLEQALALPRR